MKDISYEINKADKKEIERHLLACSESFVPPLSSYVDIQTYSEKLEKNAVTFEAWCQNRIVSLIACYLNDEINYIGFITNVSTIPSFQEKKISSFLLQQLIDYSRYYKYKRLSLEVNKLNNIAISFYEKKGFKIDANNSTNDIYKMFLNLD